jgi:hypothetical protein
MRPFHPEARAEAEEALPRVTFPPEPEVQQIDLGLPTAAGLTCLDRTVDVCLALRPPPRRTGGSLMRSCDCSDSRAIK